MYILVLALTSLPALGNPRRDEGPSAKLGCPRAMLAPCWDRWRVSHNQGLIFALEYTPKSILGHGGDRLIRSLRQRVIHPTPPLGNLFRKARGRKFIPRINHQ